MGLIATMSALVLGLLIASARKAHLMPRRSELTQMSANVIFFDRTLARYGPETKEVRELLRGSVVDGIERIWPADSSRPSQVEGTAASEAIFDRILELSPKNEAQRTLQAQGNETLPPMSRTCKCGWLCYLLNEAALFPLPFLACWFFWLAIIFASFSLFAPANATVIVTLFVCALSVSGDLP